VNADELLEDLISRGVGRLTQVRASASRAVVVGGVELAVAEQLLDGSAARAVRIDSELWEPVTLALRLARGEAVTWLRGQHLPVDPAPPPNPSLRLAPRTP
jgi:hypothetical protein